MIGVGEDATISTKQYQPPLPPPTPTHRIVTRPLHKKQHLVLTFHGEAHLRVGLVASDPARESGRGLQAVGHVISGLRVEIGQVDHGAEGGGAVCPVGEAGHVEASEC